MFIRAESYEKTYSGSYTGETGGDYVAPLSSGTTITWPEGFSIVLGTATGTKIGTSAAQKLGFWGATPVVRPSALTVSGAAVAGTAGATYTAAEQTLINATATLTNSLRTRMNELETKLQSIGALS